MSGALDWIDDRPTLLRAVGRGGRVYRIEQREPGCWVLTIGAGGKDEPLSSGILADMKALANAHEDSLAPPMPKQPVTWTRIRNGHWWGVAAIGTAYKIVKVGRIAGTVVWQLQTFANEDADHGQWLDDGSLAAMKSRAVAHATEEARDKIEEAA